MTKEEIEQYIDLDNKIKGRIVQISHALKGISGTTIHKFVPDYRRGYVTEQYDKDDFIVNSTKDKELRLECFAIDDSWVYSIDKNFLCITDEQVNEIVEYDRKEKEKERVRQEKAEEARRKRLKKEVEQKEYEQYLILKKKFEKE